MRECSLWCPLCLVAVIVVGAMNHLRFLRRWRRNCLNAFFQSHSRDMTPDVHLLSSKSGIIPPLPSPALLSYLKSTQIRPSVPLSIETLRVTPTNRRRCRCIWAIIKGLSRLNLDFSDFIGIRLVNLLSDLWKGLFTLPSPSPYQ